MLRPGGVYVQNVIDYPTFRFARAQLATLRERFEYVAAIAPQSSFDGRLRRQPGAGRVRPRRSTAATWRAWPPSTATWCVDGAALDRFIGRRPVITDDFAPIDQWLREDSTY